MKEKILAAFENLGFNLEDNESLGYSFNYEGINYLYMHNEDDEDFLNISVPCIYDLEEDNKEKYEELKEKINSTLKYVKAYTLGKGLWLFYERDLLGNEDLEEVLRHMFLHLAAALMFARDSIEKIDNGESDEDSDNDNNDKTTSIMTKYEMVVSVLQSLGVKPQIDDDGDIFVRYQMKTFYVLGANSDDEDYLVVVFPQMYEVNEGEETKVLAVCNKITREIKLTKVYIDQTLKNGSASCEFYYNGEESLKTSLDKSLDILGMVRSTFIKTMRSFD